MPGFGDSIAPPQHLQMARMRSQETERYMVRSTNNGISAIIDEKGNIIERSKQFEADSLATTIELYTGATPYARFGNPMVIIPLCILLVLFYLNGARARHKRN